ncbi:apolipoprotein N-acyltransferase [Psittacicella hinzii]|uniref:Apolipoprotein N-acyltransferase n=1 Tax=Psittacicella hinzii TaxID=2028575 RepID=A0A3A1YDP8_9GAMM|nr:apolipoprotein N-acyltransferase [Psittacicella hinzii]RIY34257.1 apolipoprotein N-acyltransferase [Psittacicella hinzii]
MIITSWGARLPLILLAAVIGYFTYLGFAPYYNSVVLYIGLFFYIFFLQFKASAKRASYLFVYVWDVAFSYATLNWLNDAVNYFGELPFGVSQLLVLGVSMTLGLRSVILAALWNARGKYFVFLPLLYSGVTYLWYNLVANFSWLNLAYANINQLGVTLAPIGGTYLVQFFQFALATFIYALVHRLVISRQQPMVMSLRRRTIDRQIRVAWRTDFIALLILVGGYVASFFVTFQFTKATGPAITTALVQPNFLSRDRQQLQNQPLMVNRYENLITQTLNDHSITHTPKLWILPEAALMSFYSLDKDPRYASSPYVAPTLSYLERIYNPIYQTGGDLVLGILAVASKEQQIQYYNTALVLSEPSAMVGAVHAPNHLETLNENQQMLVQVYNKQHLVPFGEYVPFAWLFQYLPFDAIKEQLSSPFVQGAKYQSNLKTQFSQAAMIICYDALFAEQLIRQVKADTGVLINISNDVWFGEEQGPAQHLNIARYRSLESQRYSLRATNNGITAIINHKGEIVNYLPQNKASVLVGEYRNYTGETLYQKYNRLINFALAFLFLFVVGIIRILVGIFTSNKRNV